MNNTWIMFYNMYGIDKYKYKKLTLTASAYNRKVSVHLPKDCEANTVFEAFKTLMVGLTFSERMFDDAVVNYFYERELDKDKSL